MNEKRLMTYTTYGQIHGWANASVFFSIAGSVGYSLWQLISPWYLWLPVFVVLFVILGQVGHRLIPRFTGPIIDYFTEGKVVDEKGGDRRG
jgi:hypothetical protein